jgi:hypothetical protein
MCAFWIITAIIRKMKLPVIALVAFFLLCVLIIYLTQKQTSGFDDANVCTPIIDPTICANTADCNWNKVDKKCLRCDELASCDLCSSTDKCGWCTDVNKCFMADRMGLPIGKACSDINYVVVSDLCPANRKTQPVLNVNSQLDTDQLDTGLPIQTYNNSACPDTEEIVKSVKDKVIALVKDELKKNGVNPVEGFISGQELTLGNDVMASVSETIRALVQKSVAAKNAS